MFYRKIVEEMTRWYNGQQNKKSALVIEGLRQVGKTTSIINFLESHYAHVNVINFKDSPSFKKAFINADLDRGIPSLLSELSIMMPGSDLHSPGSVLFLDEIQECARARYSIKPLCAKTNLHIVASGSLLGIRGYNRETSGDVPTGSETILTMHPMDFEEFLLAVGESAQTITYLRDRFDSKTPIATQLHERFLSLFRQYLIIGGLPEAVDIFVQTHSFAQVQTKLKSLLIEYRGDFGRYIDKNGEIRIDESLRTKLNIVLDSVPAQLAKENKRFFYSDIPGSPRKDAYRPAVDWLCEFGLLKKCHRLTNISLPLKGNSDPNAYKIYVQDTGLFFAMLDKESPLHLLQDDFGSFKGYVFENIVADAMIKQGEDLYYYSNDNGLEIDFVIPYESAPTLVEVKAKNGHTKASKTILSDKNKYSEVCQCIKLTGGNIGITPPFTTFPYYLAHLLFCDNIDKEQ